MENTVIHVDASGDDMSTGTGVIGDRLMSAVEQAEPFAAVVVMPVAAGHTPHNGRKIAGIGERVRMLKRLRPGLKQWCRGLAFVADADVQKAGAKAIRAGARMWGCPTFTTDNADAALVWATDQLAGENR
jgi:hypothetical protein